MRPLILFLILALQAGTSIAMQPDPLPQEMAFPLSGTRASNGDVLLSFSTAPGYALYKERIFITLQGQAGPVAVAKPRGIVEYDDIQGPHEVYRGKATVRVSVPPTIRPAVLLVRSQGCADFGVCYSPYLRTIRVP